MFLNTKHVLIHAPYTHIVVFWHISNIPPMILGSQICCNTTMFCIAAFLWNVAIQSAVGCYNPWVNLRLGLLTAWGKIAVKNDYSRVIRLKKLSILTQIGRFWTVIPVWIHRWLRNDAQSLKLHRRFAPLFFKIICQIVRFVIWWWIIQASSLVSHDLYPYHAVKRCIFHFANEK